MYPEFVYTRAMQLILVGFAFVSEFCMMYKVADIILLVFKVEARKAQAALFAFLAGDVLYTAWIYFVYLAGGMISFPPNLYFLVTTPNPITAILYCYIAIKIFKLSPIRSIKMMGYIYLFWLIVKASHRVLFFTFLSQTEERYNYLLDAIGDTAMVLVVVVICRVITHLIKEGYVVLDFADNRFFNPKKEWMLYFLKALFCYLIGVACPLLIPNQSIANVTALLILLLFFISMISLDVIAYDKQVIENSRIHINALFKGNEELRGIKHDFYNILQTYSGFLQIGNLEKLKKYHNELVLATTHAGNTMELSQKIAENPPFISLLINKMTYAEKNNVKMQVDCRCSLANMYIDHMDLCRMMSCILDNAIEAAAMSQSKVVHCAIGAKKDESKIIIITNSTDTSVDVEKISISGFTSKPEHSGIGLATVRKIAEKYGNCILEMKYYNYEFSTYLELKECRSYL